MKKLKKLFLLDPDIAFLNHGSFGACPKPVFEQYQQWQRELEFEPVNFVNSILPKALKVARHKLAQYLKTSPRCLAFVPNATFAVNAVARSLQLKPGDEVLATDHEYGACEKTWKFICNKTDTVYKRAAIPIPYESDEDCVERLWRAVTRRTKVIFISHITSPTACTMPIQKICAQARKEQIITVIDGAHALGQIPLNLEELGADFYTSNAHKWLCTPKGSAFFYARQEMQHLVEPLVVSWGWGEDRQCTAGSDFLDYYQWLGTDDYSAYLSIPAAIQFQKDNNWPQVRRQCHNLLRDAIAAIERLTGFPSMYQNDSFYHQMAIVRIPAVKNPAALKKRLYKNYHIEIPVIPWNDMMFLRLSIQSYNSQADIDRLLEAMKAIFRL